MAVDERESPIEKVVEFFTQGPEDRAYEEAGGDARVPAEQRTDDPKADANTHAKSLGEPEPYPGLAAAEVDGDTVVASDTAG